MRLFEKPRVPSKSEPIDTPPNLLDELVSIFAKKNHGIKLEISTDPNELAKWWVNHQEPPKGFNDIPQSIKVKGEIAGWRAPHIERVVSALTKFATLSFEDQRFIISGIEAGVPWRGDDIENYRGLCDMECMNLDSDRCLAKLRDLVKQLTRKPID